MNKNLLVKIKKYLSNHENKVKYRKIFTGLAAVVVFCTVYALIMPAITLEEELICKVEEHVHNENCYTDNFICEDTEENRNNENCYELVKTCTKEEHTHSDDCYQKVSSNSEINLKSNDGLKSLNTSLGVEDISVNATLKMYSVNFYDLSGNYNNAIMAYSESSETVGEALNTTMAFSSWHAIVVSNQDGDYVVTDVILDDSSKSNIVVPVDGFVVLVYDDVSKEVIKGVSSGIFVVADFTFTSQIYDISGIGNLNFGTYSNNISLLMEKDNTEALHVIQGADTKDLIEVNLYDYGLNINSMYNTNKKYPGFQQDGGSKSFTKLGQYHFNFGNNITSEIKNTVTDVTHIDDLNTTDDTDINMVNHSSNNSINRPISGVMNKYLIDDYPALSDGTSLAYLFSNNSSTTTVKKNTDNINGLFLHNETTGAYSFNSRENHAQFNASDNTFTLYKEMITSNFMMYPFGNFLPLNSIISQTTKASTINKAYFNNVSSSALTKANNGLGEEYRTLSTALTKFADLMDAEAGTGWDAGDAVSAYFKYSTGLEDIIFPTSNLENIYSIDYDEPTNFFFGLDMKMNFMQPKDGLTGVSGTEEMKFYFTGDDDVWVYIDDILFLDLSGIHRHVGGEIDFYNGVVNYYDLDVSTGDVSLTPTKIVKFSEILGTTNGLNSKGTFENYSTHKFNFYYMERGAGSGVMRMNFNMPLLKKNTISVTKELTVDDGSSLGNPDFKFQILSATGEMKTEIPFIGKNTVYDIYNNNGIKIGTGTVGENGIFTLKAGQTAVFSGINENAGKFYVREIFDEDWASQYKQVSVDGKVTTKDNYSNLTIGTESFTGIETDIKDASSGNTYFDFNNKVDTNKYGSLKLKKIIDGEGITSLSRNFNFTVTIDGVFLPVGTTYRVLNKTSNETSTRTVEKEGIVTFTPKEEVEIINVLVGSSYHVVEETLSDYTVSYENNIGTIDKAGQEITIKVTNTEKSTELKIPIQKIIENPDSKKHSFNFRLVRVTDETGLTIINDSTINTTIEEVETSKTGEFTINYQEPDYSNGDKLYYKITEVSDNTDSSIKYDKTLYIIEVTISKTTTFSADITKIIKIYDDIKESASTIEFKNQILTNLILEKEVQKNISGSKEFEFKIVGTYQGNLINGSYVVKKKTQNNEVNDTITFTNGFATIYLRHNETITIYNLPYGMKYEISEVNTDGYVVEYEINRSGDIEIGSQISSNLGDTNHIKFINIGGYELPATGSSRMLILIIIGVLSLIIPVIYIGYMFYKRERKVS